MFTSSTHWFLLCNVSYHILLEATGMVSLSCKTDKYLIMVLTSQGAVDLGKSKSLRNKQVLRFCSKIS